MEAVEVELKMLSDLHRALLGIEVLAAVLAVAVLILILTGEVEVEAVEVEVMVL